MLDERLGSWQKRCNIINILTVAEHCWSLVPTQQLEVLATYVSANQRYAATLHSITQN